MKQGLSFAFISKDPTWPKLTLFALWCQLLVKTMHKKRLNSSKEGWGAVFVEYVLTFPRIKASIFATNGDLQLVANIKLQTCKAMILLKLVHFSSGLYNLFLQNFCQLLLTFLVMSPFSAAIYKCGIRKSCCKGLMLRQKSHKELLHWYICQNCNLPNVSLQITLFGGFTKNFCSDTFAKTVTCQMYNWNNTVKNCCNDTFGKFVICQIYHCKQHCKALLLKLHFLA